MNEYLRNENALRKKGSRVTKQAKLRSITRSKVTIYEESSWTSCPPSLPQPLLLIFRASRKDASLAYPPPPPLSSPRVPFSPRILSPAISPRVENLIARDGRVLIFSLLPALFLRPPPPPSSIKTGRDIERKRLLRDDAAADTESMELIYPRNRSLPARM